MSLRITERRSQAREIERIVDIERDTGPLDDPARNARRMRAVDMPPMLYDRNAVRDAAANDLNVALAPWREKYPAVQVQARTAPGSAAKKLVELSGEAGLLIVGSRGHGAIVGSLLGSVGLQLLHHADCPVMIVHSAGAKRTA